jgi:MFS family permease
MFDLGLFRIRAFTAGNVAVALSSIGRGGLQFVLIVWLQGIWLPRHGYAFHTTPLWAGIYLLPEIAGILIAGPISGHLSDQYGARPFATGGMLVAAATFALLIVVPVNFGYAWFAPILFLNGIAWGLFSSPNSAGVMNSLPPSRRGVGAGMLATSMNCAAVLSIGIFFTLLVVGLSARLPQALDGGLRAHGVPPAEATRISQLPPVTTLFAAFLGYNPMKTLLGKDTLAALPPEQSRELAGRSFFPRLISNPFHDALVVAFVFSMIACLIAAVASLARGGKYHFRETVAEPALETA